MEVMHQEDREIFYLRFPTSFFLILSLTKISGKWAGIVSGLCLTLPGLKTRGFLRFYNPNILFTQVPRLSTFAQKCVLIPPVALLGETPRPHWLIFWAFSC
ncbi:MAG: hypothetical protein AN490_04400 [Anabaena sp. AL09]|nr:MAG: hypothetical protein AN490_04400 [Anabaena sp. AL09]OBQ41580.1 MAG: hypothetical protein AN485_01865 [Anabaena sp. MDT14b]